MSETGEAAVLRSAVGEENYPDLASICERLDALGCRLALSREGLDRIMRALAEELVAQRMAIEVANDCLRAEAAAVDTPTPEDPTT